MAPSPRIAIAAFALSRVLADWSCMLQAGNSLTGETTGPSSDPAAPITIWSRQAPAASDVISRGRDQLLVYIVDDTNSSSVSVVATWAANMSVAWVASLPPLTSGAGYTKTLVLAEWDGGRAMAHITNGFDSTLYEFALADGTSMRNISRSALVSVTDFVGGQNVLAVGASDGSVINVAVQGLFTLFPGAGCVSAVNTPDDYITCTCGARTFTPALGSPTALCGYRQGQNLYYVVPTVPGTANGTGTLTALMTSPAGETYVIAVLQADLDGSNYVLAFTEENATSVWSVSLSPSARVVGIAAPPAAFPYIWVFTRDDGGLTGAKGTAIILDAATGATVALFSFTAGLPSSSRVTGVIGADGVTAYVLTEDTIAGWLIAVLVHNVSDGSVTQTMTLPADPVLNGPAYLSVGPVPGSLVAATDSGIVVWASAPTATASPSQTGTPSSSQTATPSSSQTTSPSSSATGSPSSSATGSPSSSATCSASASSSVTPTPSRSRTPSHTPTRTQTPTPSAAPTPAAPATVSTGTIVGATLASLGGLTLIAGACFVWRRPGAFAALSRAAGAITRSSSKGSSAGVARGESDRARLLSPSRGAGAYGAAARDQQASRLAMLSPSGSPAQRAT